MSVPLLDVPLKPQCQIAKRLLVVKNADTARRLKRLAERQERKRLRAETEAARRALQAANRGAESLTTLCVGEMLAFLGVCAWFADWGFGWVASS